MRKLLPVLLGVALLGAGIAAAQQMTTTADEGPTLTASSSTGSDDRGGTTSTGTTTGAADVAATTVGGTTSTETIRGETGADVSGPCDEAEHASDPRCLGAGGEDRSGEDRAGEDDERSRSGSDDDNDDEDRRGSNSGRG